MKMEMEDLKTLMHTIINMKVTRQIQAVSFQFVCGVLTKLWMIAFVVVFP